MSTEQAARSNIEQALEAEKMPAGNITEAVVERLRRLPPEKQQEVLDFVEFLHHRAAPERPQRSPEGLWAGLGVHITRDDIAEARREMWGNFPREDS